MHDENLKCVSRDPDVLLRAARFTTPVCVSCALLSLRLSGLAVSPSPMLVPYLACWMGLRVDKTLHWVTCEVSLYHASSAVVLMVMVTFLEIVLFLLWLRSVSILIFRVEMDKSHWPWAEDAADSAAHQLECALGSYTSGLLTEWQLPVGFDAESAARRVPDVWTDGSLVHEKVSGTCSSGSVLVFFFIFLVVFGLVDLDDDVDGGRTTGSCRGYCSVPGPPQTVQRAKLWGVILALQAAVAVHLGVDNLSVVRHVGRLLDDNLGPCPAELVKDGDLILIINKVLDMCGRKGTCR